MPPVAMEMLKKRNYEVDCLPGLPHEELIQIIGNYDALIIRSGTKVSSSVIKHGYRLKVIGRAGVGVDNVDISAATRAGIVVMNVPKGNTISACEHTWALMLSLARNIPKAHQALRDGKWDKKSNKGMEIFGKTLGLYGLGKIGSEVARRGLAFGMRVIAYDPFASEEQASKLKVKLVEFEDLLANSDIISIHSPLNEKTKNVFNSDTFSKMKKSALLVNCARGGIVHAEDLTLALSEGTIRGAAVDVYMEEPVTDSPLFKADHIVHTPHLGASTLEAEERVSLEISEQVADYLETGKIINAVNAVSEEIPESLEKLARGLGYLAGALSEGLTKNLIISYKEQIGCTGEVLMRIILTGYLSTFIEGVNSVNARILAEDRGVKLIVQSVSSSEERWDLKITLDNEQTVEGSSAGGISRLTGVNKFTFDIPLRGNLLLIRNTDRPGIIGRIGSLLGNEGINIASMEVGRKDEGGEALMAIETDEQVAPELIAGLTKLDGVNYVKYIMVGQ
ncbi:MAG: phosphoglycerate dehydrogenase [Elusimicrobia bacterium]|nr:phosphoglycerate dehydrogenase [Elusimicrobiota bacterium]